MCSSGRQHGKNAALTSHAVFALHALASEAIEREALQALGRVPAEFSLCASEDYGHTPLNGRCRAATTQYELVIQEQPDLRSQAVVKSNGDEAFSTIRRLSGKRCAIALGRTVSEEVLIEALSRIGAPLVHKKTSSRARQSGTT